MNLPLLPTTLVGSYSQPDWLIDRARLGERLPARVRAKELWRVAPEQLEEAQNDATVLAIGDQERVGIDILADGEMRRDSYSNQFANALADLELDSCAADQISLECAQPKVDPVVLTALPSKTILLGVLDLRDTTIETPQSSGNANPSSAQIRSDGAPGCSS